MIAISPVQRSVETESGRMWGSWPRLCWAKIDIGQVGSPGEAPPVPQEVCPSGKVAAFRSARSEEARPEVRRARARVGRIRARLFRGGAHQVGMKGLVDGSEGSIWRWRSSEGCVRMTAERFGSERRSQTAARGEKAGGCGESPLATLPTATDDNAARGRRARKLRGRACGRRAAAEPFLQALSLGKRPSRKRPFRVRLSDCGPQAPRLGVGAIRRCRSRADSC